MATSTSASSGASPRVTLSLALAVDRGMGIGRGGSLPWPVFAEDWRNFKQLTWGRPLLMGRRTYSSLGRPLPGRTNIVVSSRLSALGADSPDGIQVVKTPEEGLELARRHLAFDGGLGGEIFCIGGSQLSEALLPRIDRLYLTVINGDFEADTHFPKWSSLSWREVGRRWWTADDQFPFDASFLTLERLRPGE